MIAVFKEEQGEDADPQEVSEADVCATYRVDEESERRLRISTKDA